MEKLTDILKVHKGYYKSSEISEIFNVDQSTVALWVKKRLLRPLKTPGGNFRFARAEVERLFNEMRTAASSEKRKYPRYIVDFPARAGFDAPKSCFEKGTITDISCEGVGLTLPPFSPLFSSVTEGSVIRVHCTANGLFKNKINACVRHMREMENGSGFLGMSLISSR